VGDPECSMLLPPASWNSEPKWHTHFAEHMQSDERQKNKHTQQACTSSKVNSNSYLRSTCMHVPINMPIWYCVYTSDIPGCRLRKLPLRLSTGTDFIFSLDKGWLPDALWLSGESSPSEADRCLFSLEAGTLTGGGPLRPSSGYASAMGKQPCEWIDWQSCFRERHSDEVGITNTQRLLNAEEQQRLAMGNTIGEAREEDRRLFLGKRVCFCPETHTETSCNVCGAIQHTTLCTHRLSASCQDCPWTLLSLALINSHLGQQQQQDYRLTGRWRGNDVPKVDDGSCDDPTPARGVVGQLSLLNPLLDSSDMVLLPGSALGLSCPALTPRTLLITAWARPPMEPRGEGT